MIDPFSGVVVSMSDYQPRGTGLEVELPAIIFFSLNIGSGTWSTHPHEDNWVAT